MDSDLSMLSIVVVVLMIAVEFWLLFIHVVVWSCFFFFFGFYCCCFGRGVRAETSRVLVSGIVVVLLLRCRGYDVVL